MPLIGDVIIPPGDLLMGFLIVAVLVALFLAQPDDDEGGPGGLA